MLSLAPETGISLTRNAAARYVPKLKKLHSLATEDSAFFAYVVAQEEAQRDALSLAADGKLREGARLLDGFIARAQ